MELVKYPFARNEYYNTSINLNTTMYNTFDVGTARMQVFSCHTSHKKKVIIGMIFALRKNIWYLKHRPWKIANIERRKSNMKSRKVWHVLGFCYKKRKTIWGAWYAWTWCKSCDSRSLSCSKDSGNAINAGGNMRMEMKTKSNKSEKLGAITSSTSHRFSCSANTFVALWVLVVISPALSAVSLLLSL